MTGALITLLSRTIANGLPTLSRVASPKRRAPSASKRKLTTGSLFWKCGLRVDQHVAADHDPLAHDIGAGADPRLLALRRRQNLVAGRQMPAARVFERGAGVDQLKRQLGGLAEQRLDVLGIVDARQLDEDAVLPLAFDRRLLGAGFVDAPADDLDRLVDRLAGGGSRSPTALNCTAPVPSGAILTVRSGSILARAWRASSIRPGSRILKTIASSWTPGRCSRCWRRATRCGRCRRAS